MVSRKTIRSKPATEKTQNNKYITNGELLKKMNTLESTVSDLTEKLDEANEKLEKISKSFIRYPNLPWLQKLSARLS